MVQPEAAGGPVPTPSSNQAEAHLQREGRRASAPRPLVRCDAVGDGLPRVCRRPAMGGGERTRVSLVVPVRAPQVHCSSSKRRGGGALPDRHEHS